MGPDVLAPRSTRPILAALAALLTAALGACSPAAPTPAPPAPPSSPHEAATASGAPLAPSASAAAAPGEVPSDKPAPEIISAEDAQRILFAGSPDAPAAGASCAGTTPERVRCLLGLRFAGDERARALAIELFDATGDVAGVEVEQEMDGGFRGSIHLVPEVPIGKHRRHLAWIVAASRDFDAFFAAIGPRAPSPVRYRHRAIAYRFFRSVKRTTPSAYASGWSVAYNVSGSLNTSPTSVRETLFHEIFHLNDASHGGWSARALGPIFAAIVGRCGTRAACLRPYAPGDTMVRGGTYYAFQPDNGEAVHEYAAELALRYYREQRAVVRGERAAAPAFKCGPEENRRAWAAIVEEFFGGADIVPACP